MSGFVALVDRTRAGIRRDQLQRMNHAIRHRGPDDSGSWCGEYVGLGHQQLRSTPEAYFDTQPRSDHGLTVAGDVRIDNRDELFERLPISEQPEKVPDSRVLLSAYQKWGTNCAKHIYGSFAFVIWDTHKSQLFVARDRFGVKPLYYYIDSETFAAASEKKALLTLPSVSERVDETKIGDFLISLYEDRERTFFESLSRLPPAHVMVIGTEETRRRQYWDLDPTRTVTLESDAAYERRFRELFEQAVKSRLRISGSVGTSLSGGIDSSTVTVLARDLLPEGETLHTFSNVYDEAPESDEREFIEPIVNREGIESHYVFPEESRSLLEEDEVATYLDQPPHNTMHFAVRERTKRAENHDIDVVLGGELGDSAIGYGLDVLPELFWMGRWSRLYKELQAMSGIVDAPMSHLFKFHVLTELVPDPIGRWRQKLRGEYGPLKEKNSTLDPEFVNRIDLRSRYQDLRLQKSSILPRARRLQRLALLAGRNTTNLEVLDLIHAAFGIEPRYPFTDARLIEFSLAIPPTQQFADGWTRSIMRRSLDDLLPEKNQWRPWKTSVSEAFWDALSAENERMSQLYNDPNQLARYINPESLETSHRRFKKKPTTQDARPLWRALSLCVWLGEYGSPYEDKQG